MPILRASSARNGNGSGAADLGGRDLVYLFVFVQDPESTQSFYHQVLGLEAIEGGPCKRGVTRLPVGVVKYDAGGTLLTTHAVDGEHAAEHGVTTEGSGGVALVFHTTEIGASMADLSRGGVEFPEGRTESELGTVARFHDPSGHLYYLCEPSAEALAGPALERILAARV